MKLSDVKDKIDAYYDNLNPIDFIRHFESLGYEFEPVADEYELEKLEKDPHNPKQKDAELHPLALTIANNIHIDRNKWFEQFKKK
jgi:hypothetical protein